MKKRVFSLLLALCVTLGLLPAAMAENDADPGTQSPDMTISARERTDTGLKFQVNLTEPPSDGALFAVIYESGGKMKESRPLTLQESVPVELDNVADGDIVRLILMDGEYAPLQYKQTSRPSEMPETPEISVEESSTAAFNSSLRSLIAHPGGFLGASEEEQAALEEKAEKDPYTYRRLIVSMDGALPDVSGYGSPDVITDPSSGYSILQFADEANAKACAAYLSGLPTVQYVEPDRLLRNGPTTDNENPLGAEEADFKSWGVTKIKADVLASYLQTLNDRSVTVAVADTGVEKTHPFVKDYLIEGYDFIENDKDPNDQHSHGTHVIGTVIDCMPGLNLKIMPIRVLGASGGGTATGIALGIRYAADNGANVLNLSLGGGHSNYLDDAIQYAISKGVTVVVAAGNDGGNVMSHCPSHIIPAITVAAVDSGLNRASFSNYGEAIDIAAPGVQINSSVLNGGFAQKSGTSMASPHVAAAAAMLKYGFPDKTPEEIQQALKDTATPKGKPNDDGWDSEYGYGIVNLEPFAKGEWPGGGDKPDPIPDPAPDPGTHTYELFDTGYVWEEAEAYCKQLGGHLMTVTSEAEQKILEALLEQEGGRNSYWLGGYEVSEGVYQWITGESFDYTNWAPGQPDTKEENRLAAYRNKNPYATSALGQWNDVREDGSFPGQDFFGLDNFGFICEWDGEEPEDPPTEGIFAILYKDGELVFQNNDKARQSKPVLETYPVDGATLQDASAPLAIEDDDGEITEEYGVEYAEWYDHADTITKVTILDKIQPTSTALWFHDCRNLESITGLEYLDTSKVTNMSHMFSKCYLLTDLDVSTFDTSKVTNMSHMFYGCKNLVNLDVQSFDTSAVTDMGNMFSGCGELHRVYASDSFVTAAVTNSKNMFKNCANIEGTFGTKYDANHIDKEYARLDDDEIPAVKPGYFTDIKVIPGTANVYLYDDGELVFQLREGADANRTLVKSYTIDVLTRQMSTDYAKWYDHRADIKTVTFRDRIRPFATAQWFYKCANLTKINNLEKLDTRAVTDMSMMFGGCSALTSLNVSAFDTSKVTSMRGMFEDCAGLTALDISAFDTSNVTNMSAMFKGCSGLTTLSPDTLNTSRVTDMSNMFRDCASLKALDLSSFKTNSLTNMSYMFRGCASLETLNVSAFDTSKITDMKYLFSGCASLKALDLSAFNTANVKDMQHMFAGTGVTELDLHAFDTSAVTTMKGMFQGSALVTLNLTQEDRSGWKTSAVTDMSEMFRDCSALKTVNVAMGAFSTDAVTSSENMFTGAVSIVGGRGTAYDAAHIDKGYARIDFGQREPGYFTDPNMVVLTFDANDSKEAPAEGVMEELFCSKGVAEQLPANAFTRERYDFTGWNTKPDGTGTAYADEAMITLTDDLTLYAQWVKKVVLTFDANDSAEDPAEGAMEEIIVSKGSKVEIPANAFTREGYDFKGWNTKPDGAGTAYADKATVTLTNDLTLYAQWDYSFMENLYAILYSDGELVFQWNDKPAAGRTVVKTYITDRAGYSDNRAAQNNFRAWYNEAAQINTVTFAKRIQPDDIAQWFQDCYNLTTVNNLEKLDTSLVTDMSNLFAGCASLTEVNLRTFQTANVTNLESMFEGCESIRSLDLRSFDTANVKYMESMFSGCEELTTILVSKDFVTGSVTDGDYMFEDCWKLVGGSGTKFDENYTDVSYAHVDGGTSNPGYFTGADSGMLPG